MPPSLAKRWGGVLRVTDEGPHALVEEAGLASGAREKLVERGRIEVRPEAGANRLEEERLARPAGWSGWRGRVGGMM